MGSLLAVSQGSLHARGCAVTSLGNGLCSGLSNHFWGHLQPSATAAVPADEQTFLANTDCSPLQLLLQNPRINYVGEDVGDH